MAQPNRQPEDKLTLEQVTELFKETRLTLPGERDPYFESLKAISQIGRSELDRYNGRFVAAYDGEIVHSGDGFDAVLEWVEASGYPVGQTAIKRVPDGHGR